MKNRTSILTAAPVLLLIALAACNSQPETVTAGNEDPDANTVAAAPKVELPPMVTSSKTYRCKDNSVVSVDFFNNNTALYKADKAQATGTTLTAEAEGKPYKADGYEVSGNGNEVSITAPGKGTQSCKA